MAPRKRNEWLDNSGEDDDSDGAGSVASDVEERSKLQLQGHTRKRRRISQDDHGDFEDASESDDEASTTRADTIKGTTVLDSRFQELPSEDDADEKDDDDAAVAQRPTERISRSAETSQRSSTVGQKPKGKKKTGVVYLSRIPPFMKPQTLRSYLSPFGDIGKLFLNPEDHATYQRRKRSGGNKKKSYVDGWVEFLSKKDAKMVANVLNGNIIGGKKGGYYHDDIWNIKYLRGFKWDDLTEQIARESKEREARLRAEITKAKRENESFVRDVEKAKIMETMETRRKDRGTDDIQDPDKSTSKRSFKQNVAKDKQQDLRKPAELDGAVSRVLSKML